MSGVVAASVLASWVSGWRTGPSLLPMAPATALIVLLVAGAFWVRLRAAPSLSEPWPTTGLALAAFVLAVLILLAGSDGGLPLEAWLSRTREVRNGIPVGRTSGPAAGLLAVLALSVLARRVSPIQRRVEAALAASVAAVSVVILHGYFLSGPFASTESAISVAALTAVLALFLATAGALEAGAGLWPLRLIVHGPLAGATAPSPKSFRTFALFLTGFVLASGAFWYRAERERAIARAVADHAAVAANLASDLARWVARHVEVAEAIQALAMGVHGDDAAVTRHPTVGTGPSLSRWLATLREASDYDLAALLTADGRLLAASPASGQDAAALWRTQVGPIAARGTIALDESQLGSAGRLTVWVPVDGPGAAAVAWLALGVDVRTAFAAVAEPAHDAGDVAHQTTVWRQDGDSIELLSALARDGTSRPVRVRIDAHSTLPAVQGFLGQTGTVTGTDLAGVRVHADVRRIPGTGWIQSHSVSRSALTAPVRGAAVRATLASLALALLIASAIFALWYRRDLAGARRELEHARERDQTMSRLTELDRMLRMRSTTDLALIHATDEPTLLRGVVEAAVRVGGYRMAWVGYAEDSPGRPVRPMAVFGADDGYLARYPVSWSADEASGAGPTGEAIRTGSVRVVGRLVDWIPDPERKAAARHRGFESAAAVPLEVRGTVIGALILYSDDSAGFSEEEVSLLGDIGDDVSFGIAALRDRASIEAHQSQLALFRNVMDRSTDAIYITDVETGLFIDFNETALQNLGYTADELRRLGPRDIVLDMAAESSWQSRTRALERDGGKTRRAANRRKDGTVFPVEVSLTALEAGGRRLVLSIVRDITTLVADEAAMETLQAQILRAQRMESVGRLAGGVAHDFNNLLTVINTTADLALADLPADAGARADFAEIRAAGDRAAALTRQLLAFSRQQVLREQHLDLNVVVPGFLGMLERVIGEDVSVDVTLAPNPATVYADHGQLEQVLMNLCVNARDAMPRGGRLQITLDHAALTPDDTVNLVNPPSEEFVRISVTDTGDGMPPEVVARIYEPFFTTKEPGRGTGLGLSTVYGIVKQSGGYIGLTSAPGAGTTFRIYLPIVEPSAVAEAPTVRAALHAGTETILIVEDEAAIRAVVRRVLERSGYTLLEAGSGAEALEVIARHTGPLDLVMTDLVMPGMSGIELARTLVAERPTLPVLLASGYSRDAAATKYKFVREWHLISKPYTVAELLKEIRRVLDGAEPGSAATPPPRDRS